MPNPDTTHDPVPKWKNPLDEEFETTVSYFLRRNLPAR